MAANVICPMCGHQCPLPEPATVLEVRCSSCFTLFPLKPALASPLMARSTPAQPAAASPPNRTMMAQPEAMIRYNCPRCKKSLESPVSFAGQKLNCPDCNQRLQIPPPPTPAAPPINKTILATAESPAAAPSRYTAPASAPVPPVPAVKVELVSEATEPAEARSARRESCLECGVDVTRRARVQTCPDCGSLFCSAACYREHQKHSHARKPKKRSPEVECDYCGSTEPPYRTSQISQAGWIVFALMLVFFFPLFWIGLLMTETQYTCRDCGRRLT